MTWDTAWGKLMGPRGLVGSLNDQRVPRRCDGPRWLLLSQSQEQMRGQRPGGRGHGRTMPRSRVKAKARARARAGATAAVILTKTAVGRRQPVNALLPRFPFPSPIPPKLATPMDKSLFQHICHFGLFLCQEDFMMNHYPKLSQTPWISL